jgi:hypothetical protein
LRNEARWWFLKASSGNNNWAREMVYRFVRTKNLKEMGYAIELPDSFSCECFAIIQDEIGNQERLKAKFKEKNGKVNSRN